MDSVVMQVQGHVLYTCTVQIMIVALWIDIISNSNTYNRLGKDI